MTPSYMMPDLLVSAENYWCDLRAAKTWAIAQVESPLAKEQESQESACAEDFLYVINHDRTGSEDYLYYVQKMDDADCTMGRPPYTFWRFRVSGWDGSRFDLQMIKNRTWVSVESDMVLSSHREIAIFEDIDEKEYMKILYGDELRKGIR